MAKEQSQKHQGVRLVALCTLIDKSIRHGDVQKDLRALYEMASELNFAQEQFDAMLREAEEAYENDRGAKDQSKQPSGKAESRRAFS